ncbi:alcohol dehydrogenase catalytic domain-containing protein [Nocardiopsis sp. NPDC058631]
MPGHEFTGTVSEVGSAVTGFAPGDPVAVGDILVREVPHVPGRSGELLP